VKLIRNWRCVANKFCEELSSHPHDVARTNSFTRRDRDTRPSTYPSIATRQTGTIDNRYRKPLQMICNSADVVSARPCNDVMPFNLAAIFAQIRQRPAELYSTLHVSLVGKPTLHLR